MSIYSPPPPVSVDPVDQAYESVTEGETSRWFRVTGDRFDWVFAPNKMKSFKKGQICYEPIACVELGKKLGLIEVIRKPRNMRVEKNGRVVVVD